MSDTATPLRALASGSPPGLCSTTGCSVVGPCGMSPSRTGVARSLTLPATSGLPLVPFDGLEQLLLVRVNLHGRTPHEVLLRGLPARDDCLQEHRMLVLNERHQVHLVLALNDEDALAC